MSDGNAKSRSMRAVISRPVAWRSRGVGLDFGLTCFVCRAVHRNADPETNDAMHNIAAHVAKVDEQAILDCFEQGVRMAYYHGDRSSPQIKVGSCDAHRMELDFLSSQWFVSAERVRDLVRYGQRRTGYSASYRAHTENSVLGVTKGSGDTAPSSQDKGA